MAQSMMGSKWRNDLGQTAGGSYQIVGIGLNGEVVKSTRIQLPASGLKFTGVYSSTGNMLAPNLVGNSPALSIILGHPHGKVACAYVCIDGDTQGCVLAIRATLNCSHYNPLPRFYVLRADQLLFIWPYFFDS